jgi:hypothetical protein
MRDERVNVMEPVDFDLLSKPACGPVEKTVRTQRKISAIEIDSLSNGDVRLGALSEIPAGVELEICGPGFNGRTIKARHDQTFYFVFLQDIAEPESPPIYRASVAQA